MLTRGSNPRSSPGRRRLGGNTPAARPASPALGPAEIRELARKLGVRPSKRLGQNFVTDAGTVRRIVSLAGLEPDDVVLEVGPGFGSLTLGLLPAARHVTAIEVDPSLAAALPVTVAAHAPSFLQRLTVVTADALRTGAGELPGEPPTALVANLPYNVAVPVVLHLLAELPTLRRGLVMVQAEVADRMTASPGGRIYGVPSVKLAWYADARRAGPVPRTVFWPVPNVDSGLVAFIRRDPPGWDALGAPRLCSPWGATPNPRETPLGDTPAARPASLAREATPEPPGVAARREHAAARRLADAGAGRDPGARPGGWTSGRPSGSARTSSPTRAPSGASCPWLSCSPTTWCSRSGPASARSPWACSRRPARSSRSRLTRRWPPRFR